MKVLFYISDLDHRGTTKRAHDYAFYGHKFGILTPLIAYSCASSLQTLKRFEETFAPLSQVKNLEKAGRLARERGCRAVFFVEDGYYCLNSPVIAEPGVETWKQMIFGACAAKGTRVSVLNGDLPGAEGYPMVPGIVSPPDLTAPSLRKDLAIPESAKVFGILLGEDKVTVKEAIEGIDSATREDPRLYILVLGPRPFLPSRHNIIYMEKTGDRHFVDRFANTCDAAIHCRSLGETFGNAVAEFSCRGKAVFVYPHVHDKFHLKTLGSKGIHYTTSEGLRRALHVFNPKSGKDYAAYTEFTPARVMAAFKGAYIEPSGK